MDNAAIGPLPRLVRGGPTRYTRFMAFDLVIHAPDGDFVVGSYETRTAAEKLAAIAVPPGEPWSVIEIEGEAARPAAVIDFASYQAKRRARHQKG